jgi:hypothetical protein
VLLQSGRLHDLGNSGSFGAAQHGHHRRMLGALPRLARRGQVARGPAGQQLPQAIHGSV